MSEEATRASMAPRARARAHLVNDSHGSMPNLRGRSRSARELVVRHREAVGNGAGDRWRYDTALLSDHGARVSESCLDHTYASRSIYEGRLNGIRRRLRRSTVLPAIRATVSLVSGTTPPVARTRARARSSRQTRTRRAGSAKIAFHPAGRRCAKAPPGPSISRRTEAAALKAPRDRAVFLTSAMPIWGAHPADTTKRPRAVSYSP